ncbi:MAG: alpha/beta hydrolase [Cyclobacteriaceae bacterium]
MITRRFIISLALLLIATSSFAYEIIEDIATTAGGYDIPIKVLLPENAEGKRPVMFNVHGGGWNGGSETEVPPAGVPADARYLCDRLGVIYVGLAYRCKGNNGTFALAMKDLEESISWFSDRAEKFGADMSRIGFTGGSAGTTLSALLAQRYPQCKLYVGSEGMYNLVDHDSSRSYFPNAKGREQFGLTTPEQSLAASPYYNLRENPCSTLLLHGKDDFLCNPDQSRKFAKRIQQAGGEAKVVLYEGINHTCRNPNYPEVLESSVLEIARLFEKEFKLKPVDYDDLQNTLTESLAGKHTDNNPTMKKVIGTWQGRNGSIQFKENSMGSWIPKNLKIKKAFSYKIKGATITLIEDGTAKKREFYLRKNGQFIYELIIEENRRKNRREDYEKEQT